MNSLTPEWEDCFPPPFEICLVSLPLPKCFMVGAALGKMAQQSAHETLSLYPLVVAHRLDQAHIKATHHFYFRLRVLPCDRVRQRHPLFLQGCHSACRHEVAPVLFSIHLRAGGILTCMWRLSHL